MAMLRLFPAAVVVAVLCIALAGAVLAAPLPPFIVEGRVYCDTCRAGFETSATQYIEGAKVRLECKHFATGVVEHAVEGVTDGTGTYRIELADSHEEEICEVALVASPLSGCAEIAAGRDRARVLLAHDSGLASNVRYANPLGFLKEKPLAVCGALLQQYALGDDE
ncbi:pollen-specific protein C13-like [Ananas comosus]|uniref:Pollen-specific protein C13-like n=1 Tax=Ananas comosus TaxID=4615 RepID=A0A6P5GHR7_ANACO|nr:pollen-specific protein C13-like [Ananas comosus]